MADRPDLLDYVLFFETEPEWVHSEGWYYGARFSTQRGMDRIIATIAPDEAEFSFEWWQGELLRVRLSSVMASGWEIESSAAKELLRVSFNDERVKFCELQLKPHVRVEWGMSW
ncbi:hypothetical protein HNP55_001660 [Paucibacter oligotrophus]|uniref:Uncharacterized protein n=1 Tax=Roseateles oligotrophus TaxID=1769250 RepID=A0A840L5S2_9BURK|nr:hypothetical protein [Roseateles oligotrophus]MBB4843141.1 hypothetical protein [Roseateles oligotrophus]